MKYYYIHRMYVTTNECIDGIECIKWMNEVGMNKQQQMVSEQQQQMYQNNNEYQHQW